MSWRVLVREWALCCSLLVLSGPLWAEPEFPRHIDVAGERLERVAAAEYKWLWKRITDVALYIDPTQARPAQGAILDPGYAKYLTIEYGVSVSRERFEGMTRDLLSEHWPEDTLTAVAGEVDRFCNWLQAVEPGDRYAVYWLPGRGMTLALNGRPAGTIEDPQAATVILSLWLGRAAISESQRDNLLASWRAS